MITSTTNIQPWLHVIGVGESGLKSLGTEALDVLQQADIIIGGERHHKLTGGFSARRIKWPSPFSTMVGKLGEFRPENVAILVTGDPLWYSAGALLAKEWPKEEMKFYPQLSAFQLACSKMGWSIPDVDKITVHGRPVEQAIPWFKPYNKLVVLTAGARCPSKIANLLKEKGYGASKLTVLGELGGPNESMIQGLAASWKLTEENYTIPEFHALCIKCIPSDKEVILPSPPGLPDNAFISDGNFTKKEIRSLTVNTLNPGKNKILWDLGCGCGSVGIEWLLLSFNGRAYGVEKNQKRCEMAQSNAVTLGTPRFLIACGLSSDLISTFPDPDAVFIGGGLEPDLVQVAFDRVKPYGCLVANSVTLETEAVLVGLQKEFGGQLTRIAISRSRTLGKLTAWDQLLPVTQWMVQK
ncbi:MAG: precorrin-6y C5,15-methyltransferase (decarboxylating) subunit CbiE [Rhodobacteraceae bacterium]|nr:precorrin-6y C5,15-methyltransferase (decarboxylating) subunit CbiE [Paracoccaceae bacterium]MCY4250648.1 precorrin-6y C5,15-methyltransferase (decarboxylating) subunit CbiE [Paracoccaceae bacterium]